MIDFIVLASGRIYSQYVQFVRVNKGQNIKLAFRFYKDPYKNSLWDLSSATIGFYAKDFLFKDYYDISKGNNDSAWDKSEASNGILYLTLTSDDLDEANSYYSEIEFSFSNPNLSYRTPIWMLEVKEGVK